MRLRGLFWVPCLVVLGRACDCKRRRILKLFLIVSVCFEDLIGRLSHDGLWWLPPKRGLSGRGEMLLACPQCQKTWYFVQVWFLCFANSGAVKCGRPFDYQGRMPVQRVSKRSHHCLQLDVPELAGAPLISEGPCWPLLGISTK